MGCEYPGRSGIGTDRPRSSGGSDNGMGRLAPHMCELPATLPPAESRVVTTKQKLVEVLAKAEYAVGMVEQARDAAHQKGYLRPVVNCRTLPLGRNLAVVAPRRRRARGPARSRY